MLIPLYCLSLSHRYVLYVLLPHGRSYPMLCFFVSVDVSMFSCRSSALYVSVDVNALVVLYRIPVFRHSSIGGIRANVGIVNAKTTGLCIYSSPNRGAYIPPHCHQAPAAYRIILSFHWNIFVS